MYFRKIVAALLAAVYLLSATETGELLKIPLLAEHYFDHKEDNKDNGFIEFLIQHYTVEDGTDKDAAKDSKLPFKSTEHSFTTVFFSPTPPSSIQIIRPETTCDQIFISISDSFFPDNYLAAIWQPPRIC